MDGYALHEMKYTNRRVNQRWLELDWRKSKECNRFRNEFCTRWCIFGLYSLTQ